MDKNKKKREINIKDIGYEHIIKFQERFQKVTYALFVSRKPNSWNLFSSFSHVWQPSGKLVKGKLFPVKRKNCLLSQESVFLSLSKGKHFPIFT